MLDYLLLNKLFGIEPELEGSDLSYHKACTFFIEFFSLLCSLTVFTDISDYLQQWNIHIPRLICSISGIILYVVLSRQCSNRLTDLIQFSKNLAEENEKREPFIASVQKTKEMRFILRLIFFLHLWKIVVFPLDMIIELEITDLFVNFDYETFFILLAITAISAGIRAIIFFGTRYIILDMLCKINNRPKIIA